MYLFNIVQIINHIQSFNLKNVQYEFITYGTSYYDQFIGIIQLAKTITHHIPVLLLNGFCIVLLYGPYYMVKHYFW